MKVKFNSSISAYCYCIFSLKKIFIVPTKKKSNQKKSLIFISTAKSGDFFITFIAIGYAVIAVITES
ncbi:hypothetical protein CHAB381_1727 [Campylobacter hominis ATCC BAA-381]|uniref:Uncharacterized protein n=1 Tax=Campylobacter hominis (strain ATCC BAA-381 / DSM 21671 / CCUG 45161 / LMG 19568 / NCTC 13146 / CH001A) TaxID=360107 RepID=A7I3Z8_CAMHC|nr:hypothetical protein CHAB381_1727 [Campylobacter hominis ATCC BAA-381]